MNSVPKIESINSKQLVGLSCEVSLIENTTEALFSQFIPYKLRCALQNNATVFEVLLYDSTYFSAFKPEKTFVKWATIEANDCATVPSSFKSIQIPQGLYAVFSFRGRVADFPKYMQFIFTEWLPNSDYSIDHRPHFNVLDTAFKKGDSHTNEMVYIPITLKTKTF